MLFVKNIIFHQQYRLSSHSDHVGILLLLVKIPKSQPICYQRSKNPNFDFCFDIFKYILMILVQNHLRVDRNNIVLTELSNWHFRSSRFENFPGGIPLTCSRQRECMRTAQIGPDLRLAFPQWLVPLVLASFIGDSKISRCHILKRLKIL